MCKGRWNFILITYFSNTVIVCMLNVKAGIHRHDRKLLTPSSAASTIRTCNCIIKETLSSEPKLSCKERYLRSPQSPSTYQTTREEVHWGMWSTLFKKQFANHKSSHNQERYKSFVKWRKPTEHLLLVGESSQTRRHTKTLLNYVWMNNLKLQTIRYRQKPFTSGHIEDNK